MAWIQDRLSTGSFGRDCPAGDGDRRETPAARADDINGDLPAVTDSGQAQETYAESQSTNDCLLKRT
jgi:hypothetical protein